MIALQRLRQSAVVPQERVRLQLLCPVPTPDALDIWAVTTTASMFAVAVAIAGAGNAYFLLQHLGPTPLRGRVCL